MGGWLAGWEGGGGIASPTAAYIDFQTITLFFFPPEAIVLFSFPYALYFLSNLGSLLPEPSNGPIP